MEINKPNSNSAFQYYHDVLDYKYANVGGYKNKMNPGNEFREMGNFEGNLVKTIENVG